MDNTNTHKFMYVCINTIKMLCYDELGSDLQNCCLLGMKVRTIRNVYFLSDVFKPIFHIIMYVHMYF